MPTTTVRATAPPLPETHPEPGASEVALPEFRVTIDWARRAYSSHWRSTKVAKIEQSDESVLKAIEEYEEMADRLVRITPSLFKLPCWNEVYPEMVKKEKKALDRLLFMVVPKAAGGYIALIEWMIRYLNRRCSDDNLYVIGHVLSNFEMSEFLDGGSEAEESRDPIFKDIARHAQCRRECDPLIGAAFHDLALTIPKSRGGIRAMASYAWQNHAFMNRATMGRSCRAC